MVEWLFNLRVFDWLCALIERVFGLALVPVEDVETR